MSIPHVFQGKFTEKYLKKFHLPKIQFQLLDGCFIDLLPYNHNITEWGRGKVFAFGKPDGHQKSLLLNYELG